MLIEDSARPRRRHAKPRLRAPPPRRRAGKGAYDRAARFLLHLRLNTLYVRLFGVMLHRPGPMTLLPPRLAIGLSAGIVGALLPSHTFTALVLCVLLANFDTPCAVAVLFC